MSTRAGGSAWPRHYWKNSSAFSTLSVRSPADDQSSMPTGSGRKTGAAYPLANPPVGSALNQLWVARGDMTAPDDKDAIGIPPAMTVHGKEDNTIEERAQDLALALT